MNSQETKEISETEKLESRLLLMSLDYLTGSIGGETRTGRWAVLGDVLNDIIDGKKKIDDVVRKMDVDNFINQYEGRQTDDRFFLQKYEVKIATSVIEARKSYVEVTSGTDDKDYHYLAERAIELMALGGVLNKQMPIGNFRDESLQARVVKGVDLTIELLQKLMDKAMLKNPKDLKIYVSGDGKFGGKGSLVAEIYKAYLSGASSGRIVQEQNIPSPYFLKMLPESELVIPGIARFQAAARNREGVEDSVEMTPGQGTIMSGFEKGFVPGDKLIAAQLEDGAVCMVTDPVSLIGPAANLKAVEFIKRAYEAIQESRRMKLGVKGAMREILHVAQVMHDEMISAKTPGNCCFGLLGITHEEVFHDMMGDAGSLYVRGEGFFGERERQRFGSFLHDGRFTPHQIGGKPVSYCVRRTYPRDLLRGKKALFGTDIQLEYAGVRSKDNIPSGQLTKLERVMQANNPAEKLLLKARGMDDGAVICISFDS